MAEERQILLELEVDKKGAQKALQENEEQLKANQQSLQILNNSYKQGNVTVEDYAKRKLQLKKENKELSSSNRDLIKTLDTEENSLNSLRLQLSRLTAERNNTNQATEKGKARFDQLQKSIKETTDAIKEQEEAGGDFRRSVGNYQQALKGSILDTEVFGTSINGVIDKFKGFLNPATAAVGVISALGAAYLSTGRGAQDLARASDRLQSAINDVSNSVADLVGATEEKGLLDSALRGLQSALFGIGSTVRSDTIVAIKEAIREFELLELQSQRTAKELLDQAEQQRQIRDDDTNSIEERIAANEQLFNIIDERQSKQVESQQQQIRNIKTLLTLDEGNIELQKQLLQAEFELADIREENQGFRSEALINRNSLNKELQAQKETELELLRLEQEQSEIAQIESLKRIGIAQNESKEIIQPYVNFAQVAIDSERMLTENKRKQAEIRKEIARLENEVTLNSAAQLAGSLSSLFEQNTAAYKATASIEAAISTYLAINKTLASLPFPANVISSAAIGVQGFANVAKINNLFGGGGGANASQGQASISEPRVTRTSLNGAFDRNQLTGQLNQQQSQTDALSQTVRNMPPPVVKVTDINKTQKRKSQVTVNSGL